MKVILLTGLSGATGAFSAGDTFECASADEAGRLIAAGYAKPLRHEKAERAVKPRVGMEKATR